MPINSLTWRGDAAWCLSNDHLQVVFTRCGGQIASLRGAADGPEALWQPPWPAARPTEADERWGPPAEAPLLSNICGWNLCLDRFGIRENDGGRPLHGEAGVLPWEVTAEGETLRAEVSLPRAHLRVQRQLQLQHDCLVVETLVQLESGAAREIEWCEHITLGDPLLDGARISAAAATALLHPDSGAHARSRFAQQPGEEVPVAAALAMPQAADPPCGDIVSVAMERGEWQVKNPRLGWGLRCDYDVRLFPWLCLWTEHRARESAPWGGVTRSRGMECSSKPFPEGQPPASRYPHLLGRSTRLEISPEAPLRSSMRLRFSPELCSA